METKLLVALFSMCTLFVVGEAVKCYTCTRLEWTVFSGGEDSDECEYPEKDKAPTDDDCTACAFDTRDEDFDWVGRHCIKTGTDCTNGTHSQDHPALDWIEKIPFLSKKDNPDFDTTRTCCMTDLCNKEPFDTDGATSLQITSGLLAAILFSIYYNFRQ